MNGAPEKPQAVIWEVATRTLVWYFSFLFIFVSGRSDLEFTV